MLARAFSAHGALLPGHDLHREFTFKTSGGSLQTQLRGAAVLPRLLTVSDLFCGFYFFRPVVAYYKVNFEEIQDELDQEQIFHDKYFGITQELAQSKYVEGRYNQKEIGHINK